MTITDISTVCLLVLIHSIFFIKCSEQKVQVTYVTEDYGKNETSLQCYDCNSEYDPRCGDPFNPYSIGTVNCSEKTPPEHIMNLLPTQKQLVCRKIVQKVNGRKSVVRECGYIKDARDDKDCIKRTGTKDVEVHYCACTKSLCNDSSVKNPSVSNLGLSVFLILISRISTNIFRQNVHVEVQLIN